MGQRVTKLFKKRNRNEGNSVKVESSNENESNEPCANPLEIKVIMQIVASYVIPKVKKSDLRNFILVSKLWNELFVERWRSCYAWLRIRSASEQLEDDGGGIYLDEFFITVETGKKEISPVFTNKPFRKNHFVDLITLPIPEEKNTLERLYWELYGHNLTHLKLSKVLFSCGKALNGFGWIFTNCPNLKSLSIGAYRIKEDLADEYFIYYENAEIVAKNLTSLFLRDVSHPVVVNGRKCTNLFKDKPVLFANFLKMVPNIKKLRVTSNLGYALEGLTIPTGKDTDGDEEYIELESVYFSKIPALIYLWDYVGTTFPWIETLEVKFTSASSNFTIFQNIIDLLSASLVDLRVDLLLNSPLFRSFDCLTDKDFPELRFLEINCYYSYVGGNYYAFDFRALRMMPELEIFEFNGRSLVGDWEEEEFGIEELNGGPGWELTEDGTPEQVENALRLEHVEGFCLNRDLQEDVLNVFLKWFPNLDYVKTPGQTHNVRE